MASILGCASTPPPEPASPEDLTIRKVSVIPGFSKKQLFENAKIWVAQNFSTSLDVIQYSNSVKGIIMGKTYIPHERPKKFAPPDSFEFRFSIIVETKDHKIRTTFTDMYLINAFGMEPVLKSDMEVIKPKLDAAIETLINSFSISANNDDW